MAYDRRQEDYAPSQPEALRIDYQLEIGRAYVPVGVDRGFAVLDPDRAETLRAWTSALIPAYGDLPAAGEVGAAEYADATAFAAPRIRGLLLGAIDRLEDAAAQRHGNRFAACPPDAQVELLRAVEVSPNAEVFGMVRDLTYEAYYANPRVLEALERRTGWRYRVAFQGTSMEEFDESILEPMKRLTPHYRKA
jgi:hypothetical protein